MSPNLPKELANPERPAGVRVCRPRARRFPFAAVIELMNLQSDENVRQPTSDLSLFGCHVVAIRPLSTGDKIRITIVHEGASFHALGKVVRAEEGVGMGIEFTAIEENDRQTLEKWINKLRNREKPKSRPSAQSQIDI